MTKFKAYNLTKKCLTLLTNELRWCGKDVENIFCIPNSIFKIFFDLQYADILLQILKALFDYI